MFFVYISDIEQITQKPLNSATPKCVLFYEILRITMIFQILLCICHSINGCLQFIIHQIFLQSGVCLGTMQMIGIQPSP